MSNPENLNLSDLLKCPVCWDMFSGQIQQCRNGHNICVDHLSSMGNRCPVCRVSYQDGTCRNILVESIVALESDRINNEVDDRPAENIVVAGNEIIDLEVRELIAGRIHFWEQHRVWFDQDAQDDEVDWEDEDDSDSEDDQSSHVDEVDTESEESSGGEELGELGDEIAAIENGVEEYEEVGGDDAGEIIGDEDGEMGADGDSGIRGDDHDEIPVNLVCEIVGDDHGEKHGAMADLPQCGVKIVFFACLFISYFYYVMQDNISPSTEIGNCMTDQTNYTNNLDETCFL